MVSGRTVMDCQRIALVVQGNAAVVLCGVGQSRFQGVVPAVDRLAEAVAVFFPSGDAFTAVIGDQIVGFECHAGTDIGHAAAGQDGDRCHGLQAYEPLAYLVGKEGVFIASERAKRAVEIECAKHAGADNPVQLCPALIGEEWNHDPVLFQIEMLQV